MAFTYRNPLDIAISKLPSKQADQLLALTTDEIVKTIDQSNDLFSYAIKPEEQELLSLKGIPLAPIGFRVHSHPMCKMVENYLLYICIPSLLKEFKSVAFFSLRPSKEKKFIKMFQVFNYGKIKSMGMYNAIIDSKDKFRYGDSTFDSFRDRVNCLRDDCLRANKFPKVLFLHDEVHFLTPFDIAYLFETIPEIDRVVATSVFPPELLMGDRVSKEPRVYSFKVRGDDLTFYPDGVASECYVQKMSTSAWPFQTSSIKWANRCIRVSKIQSLFAHHVLSFDRGKGGSKLNHFDKPSCLLAFELRTLTKRFNEAVVNRSVVSSLSTYMACLKTANAASAVAKLRQLEKRDLLPDELNFVYSFGDHFKNYGMRNDLDITILQWIKDKICDVMPHFIAASFFAETEFHKNFRDLNYNLATKGFEVLAIPMRLDQVRWIEFNYNKRIFAIAEAIGVKLCLFGKRFTYDTESESYFSKDGFVFYERSERNHVLNSTATKIDYGKIIKARHYKLWHDFLKPIARGKRFREQKYIEWFEEEESDDESIRIKIEELRNLNNSVEVDELNSSEVKLNSEDKHGFEGSLPSDVVNDFLSSREEQRVFTERKVRKNDCVFKAIATFLGKDKDEFIEEIADSDISDELFNAIENDRGLSHDMITEILIIESLQMCYTDNFEDMSVLNRKFGLRGTIYCTIRNNHCELVDKACFKKLLKDYEHVKLNGSNLTPESLFDNGKVKHLKERAQKLAKSLNRGTSGILKEINSELASNLVELCNYLPDHFESDLGMRLGFAGSGKTFKVLQWIKYTPTIKRMFISPRRALLSDVAERLKGTNCHCETLEVALGKVDLSYTEIYIDEIGLMPPGYLTILAAAMVGKSIKSFSDKKKFEAFKEMLPKLPRFNCLGDPLQCRYYCETDNALLDKVDEIDFIRKSFKNFKYLFQGFRFGKWFSEIVNIPTRDDESKHSRKFFPDMSKVDISKYKAVLVGPREAKISLASGLPVYTVMESQGLTFNGRVLICLDEQILAGGPSVAITAITRATDGFDFVMRGSSPNDLRRSANKGIWQFLMEQKEVPMERIVNLLPGASFYEDSFEVGNSSIQDKASSDPMIMPFINLAEEECDPEEVVGEIVEAPEWFKCHVPVFDCDPMLAEMFDKIAAKERREFTSMLGYSNQFLDMEKKGSNIDVYPMSRQSVFPHHQGSDDVTFWAGVRKRIKKSNWRREATKLESVQEDGKALLREFLKMLPKDFKVNTDDIDAGEKSFIEKRKQKTEKMWEAHSNRSDIDWNLDHVFLFMKSQYCTKEAKMFTEAKAGQTLACFQHIVLFRFGPMLRAIEAAFLRACGESYYIHSGKNFFALDTFVTRNASFFDGESIESDYTAFDSSQDHTVLAFEIELLKHLGVSNEFIMDYKKIKLTLGCRLGSLAIMRFTGEFCTFLFNTFANMLFTNLKYKIDPHRCRILFAGDDMCSLTRLRKRNSKESQRLLSQFSLEAVEESRKFPMFCGWYLSPYGILKSPKLLWARIAMMRERNLLAECVDNYLFEAIFAYRLGERLYRILKEEDVEYHYMVVRFFVKNSKLLRGASKSLILEIGEGIGSWPLSMSTHSLQKPNQKTLRLMQSGLQSCIKMQQCLTHQSSIALSDLKLMLRCMLKMDKICASQIFSCLTKMRLNPSGECQENTNMCMLGSYLLQSEQCFQIIKEKVEESLFMMGHASMMTRVKDLLLQTSSPLLMTLVILLSGHLIYSRPLMHTLQTCYGSQLTWIAQNTRMIGSLSLLTSGLLIECVMPQGFLTQKEELTTGLIRLYTGAQPSNMDRTLKEFFQDQEYLWKSETEGQTSSKGKGFLGRMNSEDLETLKLEDLEEEMKHDLGPARLELIDIQRMSLENVIRVMRAHRVTVYLWENYIDKEKKLKKEPPSPDSPEITGEGSETYKVVSKHFVKYLFGNIAVFGSSEKTEYPDIEFYIPEIKAGDVQVKWKISLGVIVPEIKSFCGMHDRIAMNRATWRNICEAFAEEAMMFLKERFHMGTTTAIYKKFPKAFAGAPHVVFDFASGLDMSKLNPNELTVIDKMTKRLFRTEGQKGIFEANQEVNLELEG
ncbi:putative 239.6 kDa polyprotein [Yacon virus A]|uniref:putative 239.6 kDa polyprotein n=1 Tax=Yacon virus A TaxID=1868472 RepID=UPI000809959A|nr:putative 239.6 kDa polyprotein [Yacon virus A]ANR76370.1 putative 239.6 kDa polyprotein [Yacon virus A]